MNAWRIPLFNTDFGVEEEEAVLRPLRAGWLTMGEEVLELERELCSITGAAHAVAVSSATTALQLACVALGTGPGDEVLVPTLTFVATANAPRSTGARVILCESTGPDDLNVDPASIASQITDRTRAILIVHYAGFACRMADILAVAAERDIPVIEDAAHAVFTRHRGRTLGLFGRVGCFSFYSNKNVTCGEGGALITDDGDLAAELRLLRSHGMTAPTLDRHRGIATSYDVLRPGFNGRMDEMRAALLRAQLERLPGFLDQRRKAFVTYVRALRDAPIEVPFSGATFADELADTGVHIMSVLLPEGTDRGRVMAELKQAGIQTSIHYPPIHRFRTYRTDNPGLTKTGLLADRQLTLPLYPALTEGEIEEVVEALVGAL